MKRICIAATVIGMVAMIASPVYAQSRRKAPTQYAPQATSPGVYTGRRGVNTDPDPNVQFEIMRQQNWRKGG
jgi:hypothetical protein